MNKPMKTAAALRASDTEFLHQDSMPKLIEEITKPKQSPVQEAAFRAAKTIIRDCSYEVDIADVISAEFAFVDELVECLRECHRELNIIRARDGVPYCFDGRKSDTDEECFSQLVDKARALLDRIEKGTK